MLDYLPWTSWMDTSKIRSKTQLPTSFWSSVNIEVKEKEEKLLVKKEISFIVCNNNRITNLSYFKRLIWFLFRKKCDHEKNYFYHKNVHQKLMNEETKLTKKNIKIEKGTSFNCSLSLQDNFISIFNWLSTGRDLTSALQKSWWNLIRRTIIVCPKKMFIAQNSIFGIRVCQGSKTF